MMFAHPISEVYVDMKPAFAKLGVADFEPLMQAAIDKAASGAPADDVSKAVDSVLAALQSAAAKAPKSEMAPSSVETKVLLEMLNRAALQYSVAYKPDAGDAYIDGFGFLAAAKARAANLLANLKPDAAGAVKAALAQADEAYPDVTQPEAPAADAGALMAAVSKAMLAAGAN